LVPITSQSRRAARSVAPRRTRKEHPDFDPEELDLTRAEVVGIWHEREANLCLKDLSREIGGIKHFEQFGGLPAESDRYRASGSVPSPGAAEFRDESLKTRPHLGV
jgi:hypothetical protein